MALAMSTVSHQTGSPRRRVRRGQRATRRSSIQVRTSRYFRLSRIRYHLRNYCPGALSISTRSTLVCAVAIEAILDELFNLATRVARIENKRKVKNRHITFAIDYSEWLKSFFYHSIIPDSQASLARRSTYHQSAQ